MVRKLPVHCPVLRTHSSRNTTLPFHATAARLRFENRGGNPGRSSARLKIKIAPQRRFAAYPMSPFREVPHHVRCSEQKFMVCDRDAQRNVCDQLFNARTKRTEQGTIRNCCMSGD